MRRSRFIYVVTVLNINFHLHPPYDKYYNLTKTGTHFFFRHFLEYFLLFLDNMIKNASILQIAKDQSQGVAYSLLIFFVNFSLLLLIKVLCCLYNIYLINWSKN